MLKHAIAILQTVLLFQVASAQAITEAYDYPIKRHTEAWDSLKTYKKFREVSQVPAEIVNRMTTEALFESVLNYPLIGDAFVFNTFQNGIESLKTNFSALEALINRNDLGKIIFNKYQSLSAKNLDYESAIKKGDHSVKLSFMELIIGQVIIDKNVSGNEIVNLINILVSKYNEKKIRPEIYGTLSLSTCAFAINRLMIANNANEKFINRDRFVEDGNVFSQEVLDSILNKAQLYIKP
jgi:hypothetical protein